MARWEPDARGRLQRAALELYRERGFEQTTVADLAERAGVTERTFFRHFADKREVLFDGGEVLQQAVVDAVLAAPASCSPVAAVGSGMAAGAAVLQERRDYARQRAVVIAANPGLQERELFKLAALTRAAVDALRRRGVPEPVAALSAEVGVAAFKIGFERWITDFGSDEVGRCVLDTLDELRALTAPG